MNPETILPAGVHAGEFAAIVGALITLGAILKHTFESLPNRRIPLILLAVGTAGTIAIAEELNARVVVLGFAAVTIAIGTHQIISQTSGKDI